MGRDSGESGSKRSDHHDLVDEINDFDANEIAALAGNDRNKG
jgi:hypothetical protein